MTLNGWSAFLFFLIANVCFCIESVRSFEHPQVPIFFVLAAAYCKLCEMADRRDVKE